MRIKGKLASLRMARKEGGKKGNEYQFNRYRRKHILRCCSSFASVDLVAGFGGFGGLCGDFRILCLQAFQKEKFKLRHCLAASVLSGREQKETGASSKGDK
jgi:hypothetical protein